MKKKKVVITCLIIVITSLLVIINNYQKSKQIITSDEIENKSQLFVFFVEQTDGYDSQIWPTLYLKEDVKFISGTGTYNNPYIIS